MIVCHCHAVSDREVVDAVEAGALDAEDVAARCGAGGSCGGCRQSIEALLDRPPARVLIRTAA